MDWTDRLGNALKQYTSGGAVAQPAPDVHAHFDQVARAATPNVIAESIAAAFNSDKTPVFGQMLSTLFNNSTGDQKAGMINRLLSSISPGTVAQILSGVGIAGLVGGAIRSRRRSRPRSFHQRLSSNLRPTHKTRIHRLSNPSATSTLSTRR